MNCIDSVRKHLCIYNEESCCFSCTNKRDCRLLDGSDLCDEVSCKNHQDNIK